MHEINSIQSTAALRDDEKSEGEHHHVIRSHQYAVSTNTYSNELRGDNSFAEYLSLPS